MSTVAKVEWGLNVCDDTGKTWNAIRDTRLAYAHNRGFNIWAELGRVHGIAYTKVADTFHRIVDEDWVHIHSTIDNYAFVAKNMSTGQIRDFSRNTAMKAAALKLIEEYEVKRAFEARLPSRPINFGSLLPSSSRVEEVHNELVPALAPRVQEPNVLSVEQLEAEILRRTQALVRAEMQQMALRTQSQSEGSNGNGTVAMVCKYGLIALAILVIGGLMFLSIVANVGIAYYQKNAVPPPAPQQQAPQQQAPQLDLVQALQTAFFAGQQSMFRPEQNAPTMQVQYHDRQGTQIHEQCKNGVCEAAVTPFKQAPAKKEFQSYVNKETPEEDDEGEPVVITKKSKADKKKAQQKSRVQQEEVDTDEKEVKTEQWTIGWNFSGLCWFLGFVIIVLVASQPVWVWLRRLLF